MRRPLRQPVLPDPIRELSLENQQQTTRWAELLQAVLQQVPAGVIVTDAASGKVVLNNRQAEKILRSPAPGLLFQESGSRVCHPDGPPYALDELPARRALKGEEVEREPMRIGRGDATRADILVNARPVRDDGGRIVAAVVVFTDVTGETQTEARLSSAERMASNGQLVAAVAHEMKNPLGTLSNLMYMMQQSAAAAGLQEPLAMAQDELKRVRQIISHTVGLYRESSRPLGVKLAEVLDSIVEFYGPKAQRRQVIIERRFKTVGLIQAFPAEMRQLFTNLFVNALDAVPQNGRVILRLRQGRHWANPEVEGVRVTVADNGGGIAPQHRRKIFDPAFTTKGEQGTGLGLWITQDIVRRRGGSLRMRSGVQPGRSGTSFSVFLPKALSS